MPVMDGYTATRILRAPGLRRPDRRAHGARDGGDRERCLAAGCDDYATKPIDRGRFYALLRRHLAEPKDE